MRYFTFPKLARVIYPGGLWEVNSGEKSIYLTFDDGPCPASTEFILDLLAGVNGKATFFCLGNNVEKHPSLYHRIKEEGHAVGNHGYEHIKGWGEATSVYVENALKGKEFIHSNLYRPAYGKMTKRQFNALKQVGFQMVFWSIISYDFDATFSSEERQKMLMSKVEPGSNIVFHDSEKAFAQLKIDLPILVKKWSEAGYTFKAIPQ